MSRRTERLGAQLKKELALLLQSRVKDPRIGRVTVTHVRVTSDLTQAKVFVRLPGDAGEVSAALDGLEAAAPFIRRELGGLMKIRRSPELVFEEDQTLDQALRIEELLGEVRPEEGWEAADGDEADGGEEEA